MVCFIDGWVWSVTEGLRNICLGKEEDVRETLETGIIKDDLVPAQRKVLNWILDYRRKNGITESGVERRGNHGVIGGKSRPARPSKVKRLPLHPPRAKNKNLSCR